MILTGTTPHDCIIFDGRDTTFMSQGVVIESDDFSSPNLALASIARAVGETMWEQAQSTSPIEPVVTHHAQSAGYSLTAYVDVEFVRLIVRRSDSRSEAPRVLVFYRSAWIGIAEPLAALPSM